MAAPARRTLAAAAAQGDVTTPIIPNPSTIALDSSHIVESQAVEALIQEGGDLNKGSQDGMTPLGVAAFWGYADVAKVLLKHGADVNTQNLGTKWTPLHCAAFQGHGPVIMHLMQHNPDLALQDHRGRTSIDFASAFDAIWPFFAAAGCQRTPKSKLIEMDVVEKVSYDETPLNLTDQNSLASFSRPGSAYAVRSRMPHFHRDPGMEAAAVTGDVLAGEDSESSYTDHQMKPTLSVWNN